MNVLIMTAVYSARKFTGVSMVNYFLDMIAVVNKIRDDISWFVGVPCTDKYIEWSQSDFDHLDRVTPLPILAPDGMDRSEVKDGFCGIDHPWFGPESFRFFSDVKKSLMMDVVISGFFTSQEVIRFQAEYSSKYHYMLPKVGLPSVLNILVETGADPSLFKLKTPIGEKLTANSMSNSTATIALNQPDVPFARKIARTYLSPSIARGLKIEHFLPPLDLEKVVQYERPDNRCNFFHGGTFEGKRHLGFISKTVGDLFAMNMKCRLYICTQWDAVPEWLEGKEHFIDMHYNVARPEYLERMKDGDFLTCYIDYEGTGLGPMEAIASGMTPVILEKPWIKGRIPDGYKLCCKGEKDFAAAMAFCAKEPKAAKAVGADAVKYIRKIYNAERIGAQWSQMLDFCMHERNKETRARAGKHFLFALVSETVSGMPGDFTKEDLLGAMADRAKKLDVKKLKPMWPQLRAIALALGYTQSGEIFSRKEVS